MYTGKHDVRITARCPHCGEVTVKEIDYRVEGIGAAQVEVIDAFNCKACAKVAFKEERQPTASAMVEDGKDAGKL